KEDRRFAIAYTIGSTEFRQFFETLDDLKECEGTMREAHRLWPDRWPNFATFTVEVALGESRNEPHRSGSSQTDTPAMVGASELPCCDGACGDSAFRWARYSGSV